MPCASSPTRRVTLLVAAIVGLIPAALTSLPTDGVAVAQASTSAGWTTNAAVRPPTTVSAGTPVTITATVTSSSRRSALIDVEVNDGLANVGQTAWDRQSFKAGQTRTYTMTFTPSAAARLGSYTVRVGVFGTGWSSLLHWNGNAATLAVVAATTTTTTAPPTTTTAPPTTTTTSPPTGHFSTLPVGATLPSEADCAGRVRPAAEIRSYNGVYNHTKGSKPLPENPRVTGNFTGTTDEIVQWAACKWGIDEDIVRAQIAKETWWKHASGGDLTSDQSQCYPTLRTTDGSPCPESYGLGQVRYPYHMSAMADSISSSAFNLDYTYSAWRSCYNGEQTWLNQFERGKDYAAGDVWGCVGLWFAGRWYTQPANDYIAAVQSYLSQRIWQTGPFITFPG